MSVEVFSDASGSFGCGAFASSLGWFQLQWPEDWHAIHITAKELVPIMLAAALWGPQWTRKRIAFRSDNMAVVELLKSCTSQDPLLMHMLHCLAFYTRPIIDSKSQQSTYLASLTQPQMLFHAIISHYFNLLSHRVNQFPYPSQLWTS